MSAELLDLDAVVVDPVCAVRIPAQLALRRLVLPLAVVDGALHVAMADPADAAALPILPACNAEPMVRASKIVPIA